jgi:hypothetical protein
MNIRMSARGAWAAACLVGLIALIAANRPLRGDETPSLTVPVKDLSSGGAENDPAAQQPAMTAGTAEQDRPQPTTPGGKLPQYQLGHHRLAVPSADELQNPRLRLILALPAEPVLIEAEVTIDGQPFHTPRERRVEQIVKEAEAGETSLTEVSDRVRRYRQATGAAPSADEVRWLLTNWIDGPTLLLLNDNFQRFRADQRPVFHVLDGDRDGKLSTDERQRAAQSFGECDLNRNDLVEYAELAEAANDPRRRQPARPGRGPLLVLLPDESQAPAAYRRLAASYSDSESATMSATVPRFDANSDGRFDADELAALRSAEPDVRLTVAFRADDPSRSRLTCAAASPRFTDAVTDGKISGTTVTLPLGGALVEFSAVQDGASDQMSDQVSLGAVDDGYPLLPVVDPNEDGRFTIRELRGLPERLGAFDRNGDERVTGDEVPPTLRVCFGLGPQVHRELAGLRRVRSEPATPPVAGPEWFVRMDRNDDGDLARGEFPGTDEQFADLDADGDGLVAAEEALSFDKTSPESQDVNSGEMR